MMAMVSGGDASDGQRTDLRTDAESMGEAADAMVEATRGVATTTARCIKDGRAALVASPRPPS